RVDRINSLTVEPTIAAKLPEGPVIDPGATKLADLPAPPVQEATPRIDVPGVVKDPAGKEMAGMVRDLLDEAGKGETPAATEPEVKHPEEVPSGIEISIVPPEAGSEMPGLPETVTKEPEAKGTIDPTAIELRRLRDALNSTAKAPETTGPSAEELAAKAEDEQRLAALAAAAKAEAEQRDADALAAAKAEAEQRDADALAAAKAEEENRIAELAALAKAEQERRDADAALAVAKAEEENRIATLAAIAKAEQEQRDADAALEAARVKEEQRVAMLAAIAKAEEEQRVAALATAKMEQEQRDADAALAASIAAKLPKVEEKIPEVKVPEVKIPEVDSKGSEFAVKDPEVKIPSLQPKELVKVDPHAPVEPGPIGLEPEVEVAIKIKTPKETAPIEPGPMETKIIEPAGDVIQAAYIETEFEVEWD
ncbi:MAG: hypothetical protein HN370_00510, partial [Phycisphaerales bacterium]|nr:hypothetical protein [Phycisphaerales bacterium]